MFPTPLGGRFVIPPAALFGHHRHYAHLELQPETGRPADHLHGTA